METENNEWLRNKSRKFAEKHPKYHKFVKRHPWLPGLYLIIAGILLIIMWYLKVGQDSYTTLFKPIFENLHIIGIAAMLLGTYIIVRYTASPQTANKEFSNWEKDVRVKTKK